MCPIFQKPKQHDGTFLEFHIFVSLCSIGPVKALSLSTVVLNSMDQQRKLWLPNFHTSKNYVP